MKDKTVYTCTYKSKLGDILLAADAIGLTGLWFEGQKYFANTLPDGAISQESLILTEAKRWLDIYFFWQRTGLYSAAASDWLRISTGGVADLLQIPYGQTTTYGEIAKKLAKMQNASHMSAQAVGGAVGHNEVSIIIPCHRVVGTNGSLTGYAGGIDNESGTAYAGTYRYESIFLRRRKERRFSHLGCNF